MPDKFHNSCCFGRDNWNTTQRACLATLVHDIGLKEISLRYPLISLNIFNSLSFFLYTVILTGSSGGNQLIYSVILLMNKHVSRAYLIWMISITSHGKQDAWFEDKIYVWKARSLGSSSDCCTASVLGELWHLGFNSSDE